MAEFDDGSGKIYAGHLGSFWAPPFYSDFGTNKGEWENRGFNFGLVFSDGANCFTESPTDIVTEEAIWYPSKTVVKKAYEKIEVRGVRIPLPAQRGFALKLTLKNKTNMEQNFRVLLLGFLPAFDTLIRGYDSNSDSMHANGPWVWLMRKPAAPKGSRALYDSEKRIIAVGGLITPNLKTGENYQGSMVIALDKNPLSWELSDSKSTIYNSFRENCQMGRLKNQNGDSNAPGSAFGLVSDFTKLGPAGSNLESKTITMIIGLGESEQRAMDVVNIFRNKDVEQEADLWWNNRLQKTFSSYPQFGSGDKSLNAIFKNSVLTYLVNRWETIGVIGEAAGYGQSIGFFPWLLGTSGFFPMADGTQWKNQLKLLLQNSSIYGNCRAIDFIGQDHLCDTFYAYQSVSIIDMVYKYIAISGDNNFLKEKIGGITVFDHLLRILSFDEQKFPQNDLIKDFGNDWNLYEYTRHAINCNLGGKYTGQVVSPNFERVEAYRQMAELAEKEGLELKKKQFLQIATDIKNRINSVLWDNNAGWFKTLSWWPACERAISCQRKNSADANYFYNIAPYFLLQYDDLLSPEQGNKLLARFKNFIGNYGLYSLDSTVYKDRSVWCSNQTDWHGPGLYSGAVGAVLSGLFKNNKESLAYEILQKYQYLEKVPYFSQALPAEVRAHSLSLAYLEGVSLAQSLIEGMFGIRPRVDMLTIEPHIPDELLLKGEVFLKNLNVAGQLYNIFIQNNNNHRLEMTVAGNSGAREKFAFKYGLNGKLELIVKNLSPQKYYSLKVQCLPSGKICQEVNVMANANGTLNLDLNLIGLSGIEWTREGVPQITPTPSSPTKTCSVSISPSASGKLGERITLSVSGKGNNPNGEQVRLYLQRKNGERISPLPADLQNKERIYENGKYHYLLGNCLTTNQETPCSFSYASSSLPSGDYIIHCDLPNEPPVGKCSGCPFCRAPIGEAYGDINCAGWSSCSESDRAYFSITTPSSPTKTCSVSISPSASGKLGERITLSVSGKGNNPNGEQV
ncbi:hypothetical protein KBI33_02570, partial [Candidatus Shapirobacteria bacterium]|nr:hypothetical protein [Candidatus Shapirobacteria bacterium]